MKMFNSTIAFICNKNKKISFIEYSVFLSMHIPVSDILKGHTLDIFYAPFLDIFFWKIKCFAMFGPV